MNDVLLRIREVFKESGKSQTEIGNIIDKTPQYVWRIMNVDELNPSKSVIKTICREFNINEEWLRTGDGEMYKTLPPEDDVAAVVSDLLEEDNPFYDLIVGIMRTYQKLDSKSQDALKNLSKELLNNIEKREDS